MGIIIIGLLGLVAMQLQSQKAVKDSGNQALAIWIIDDLVNRIRANETGDYATGEVSCDDLSTNVTPCAAYNDGSNIIDAQQCTEAELVSFDLVDILCGMPAQADGFTVRTTSADALVNPRLIVTNTGSESVHTITLSWASKAAVEGQADNNEFIISNDNFQDNLDDSGELRSQYSVTFRP